MEELAQELFGCNFQDLVDIDHDLTTYNTCIRECKRKATTMLGLCRKNISRIPMKKKRLVSVVLII